MAVSIDVSRSFRVVDSYYRKRFTRVRHRTGDDLSGHDMYLCLFIGV